MLTAERYHDISCGHRVVGHENKCRHLHGHNYRVHFICTAADLDHIGRVIDFGVIKERLCMWIENNWDHKFLAWKQDPVFSCMVFMDPESRDIMFDSLVFTDFNPTAENMAQHLVEVVGPKQLEGTGVELVSCMIEETAKCSASFYKD